MELQKAPLCTEDLESLEPGLDLYNHKLQLFVKKLEKYCAANCVYISDIKKPYLSLFVPQNGFDFTMEKKMSKPIKFKSLSNT